ncbi:MAG: exosortase F system-associated protein [Flavobacteriaceae bacterium]|nr:exosortase F system-associated protein [Flavobacteriaceae bacterium]
MKKRVRIPLIILLFLLLILVRAFSAKLFYDPFIKYFENDYLYLPIPEYNTLKLFFYLLLRYTLNGVISLAIIYLAFQKKGLVRFSIRFYVAAFVVLAIAYYILLKIGFEHGYLFGFYVRRFLIHPVFLLILLPAFYYQKKLVRSSSKA